ncbi:MAG: penicillin acylase family protein [Promethearchaeota archaeon]
MVFLRVSNYKLIFYKGLEENVIQQLISIKVTKTENKQLQKKTLIKLLIASSISIGMIIAFSLPFGMIPPLGKLLLPGDGIWNVPAEVSNYETLEDPKLSNDVKVFRDEWGIPHIYGYGEDDLMFALGYCQAQDRMIQMDLVRRLSRGRLSEIIGPDALETDEFNILRLEEYWANKTVDYLASNQEPTFKAIYQMLLRYVDGINKYIENNKNQKPFEYQFLDVEIAPWELVDTLVYAKYMSEYFTWTYKDMRRYENMRILGQANYSELYGFPAPYQIPVCPNYGEYDDISVPTSQFNPTSSSTNILNDSIDEINSAEIKINKELKSLDFISSFLDGLERFPEEVERIEREYIIGSNNWAISGNKTESGKPLLCTDMHLGWSLPGMWYEAHLVDLGSDLNIYAVFVPGVPLPVAGHNGYVGWGETIASFDLIDWYYYNGINETHYEYKGKPKAYEIMEETILVKGQDPVKYTFKMTVHGPVFTDLVSMPDDFSDNVIACKWTSYNITLDFLAMYGFMHAKNVYEFDDAIRYMDLLPLNLVFADIDGNIGIRPNAKVPIRNDTDIPTWNLGGGDMPYNGSKGEGEWIGYLDFDDRPYCFNPEQGFLASANQYIAGPDYPNVSVINDGGATGYRARRINNLLAQGNEFNVEDMKKMQLDIYSVRAGNFTPYFLNALDQLQSKTTIQQEVYDYLNEWDYKMDKNLVAPTLYHLWVEAFRDLTFQDEQNVMGDFGIPSYAVLEKLMKEFPDSKWFDNISTSEIESRDDIMIETLNIVLDGLIEYFGSDDLSTWKWGTIHKLQINHIMGLPGLGKGSYPGDGEAYTINPSYGSNFYNGQIQTSYSRSGASERIIVDFGDMNNSVSIIPSGERGISSSVHYSDQLEMFLKGEYHSQYFDAKDPETLKAWARIETIIIIKKGGD